MRNGNHVRDRLSRLEQEVADLRALRQDVARLLAIVENARWLARTGLWLGCTVAAHGASGGLGKLLSELAKLLGRGLA
jgi:NADPH:quinone reductase-like Zn-dependent oxidoreductase